MIRQEDSTGISCPQCTRVSYNPNDVKNRYCGNCHMYHDDMARLCLDCRGVEPIANDGGEVTCATCGGFRMMSVNDLD